MTSKMKLCPRLSGEQVPSRNWETGTKPLFVTDMECNLWTNHKAKKRLKLLNRTLGVSWYEKLQSWKLPFNHHPNSNFHTENLWITKFCFRVSSDLLSNVLDSRYITVRISSHYFRIYTKNSGRFWKRWKQGIELENLLFILLQVILMWAGF